MQRTIDPKRLELAMRWTLKVSMHYEWDASVAALAPVVDSLLPSALDLVNRLIDLRD